MPTGTRQSAAEAVSREVDPTQDGDPRYAKRVRPHIMPRSIDVAWASITAATLLPGELVYNRDDQTLVLRESHDTIRRFDGNASRTI